MTIKGRPTVYKGIQMRSRLEARYAAELDKAGHAWTYEPKAFANENGQYLPDFQWLCDEDCGKVEPHSVYVEVKPTRKHLTQDVLERMPIIWDSEPEAILMIVFPPEETEVFVFGTFDSYWHIGRWTDHGIEHVESAYKP